MHRPAKLHMYVGYYDDLRLGMVLACTQQQAAKAAGTNATDFKRHWVRRDDMPEGVMLITNRLYTRPRSPLVDVPWTLGVVEIKEDAEEAVDSPPPREYDDDALRARAPWLGPHEKTKRGMNTHRKQTKRSAHRTGLCLARNGHHVHPVQRCALRFLFGVTP